MKEYIELVAEGKDLTEEQAKGNLIKRGSIPGTDWCFFNGTSYER